MAHNDPLTELPPPSRFDPDELEVSDDPQQEQQQIFLPPPFTAWSIGAEKPQRPQLLLICFSRPSCTLLHHIPGKKLVASIILPEISMAKNTAMASAEDQTCCLYSLDGHQSILAAAVQYSVPPERSHAWAEALFGAVNPESTLVVELVQVEHFRSKLSVDEPMQFVLESDKMREDDPSRSSHGIPPLPSGSLIDGPAAAVLTHCQVNGLRCRMLVSWPVQEVRLLGSSLQRLLEYLPGAQTLGIPQASKASVGKRGISSFELFM